MSTVFLFERTLINNFNFNNDDLFCVNIKKRETRLYYTVSNTEKSVEKLGHSRVFNQLRCQDTIELKLDLIGIDSLTLH